MSIVDLEGVPLDQIRVKIATFLVKAAAQGSTPSATAVLDLLAELDAASAGERHRAQLAALSSAEDKAPLCRYLGELGCPLDDVTTRLGRPPSPAERVEWLAGSTDRELEIRAIDLDRCRRGREKPPAWSRTRPRRGNLDQP